ncbi:MAG: GT-D fold domain-containing glycosyltransferase [Syntrophomonas sp.]
MQEFIILEEDFVELPEILKRVRYCLRNQMGFSLVRVGDAENQVLAQGAIYSNEDIENIWWAKNEDWTGIVLPNYEARDRLIAAIREADVVGVLHQDEEYEWKALSEKAFSLYNIKPRQLCYAFINIYMVKNPDFIALLKNHRVLLIGKAAPSFAVLLKTIFKIEVAGSIMINNYYDIPDVLKQTKRIDYELALISAGSNAVILSAALARQKKVALDLGSAMKPSLWIRSPHPRSH